MSDRQMPAAVAGAGVVVYADEQRLAEAAARVFADEARHAVERTGKFCVALSGGSTPRLTYGVLTGPPFSDEVPWDFLHVFWGDERCVAPGDPRSNERLVRESLLDHVGVPPEQVHPLRCGGGDGRSEAAAHYEELLRETIPSAAARPDGRVGLDLVLLGLGEDGHTASLFPGSAALRESVHWVADSMGGGTERVTLTASFINQAGLVLFLVAGEAKARIVRQVLEGTGEDAAALPARLIRPVNGRLLWLIDRDAAALLTAALRDGGLAPAASPALTRPQESPL